MYKKKNRMPMLVTAMIVGLLVVVLGLMTYMKNKPSGPIELETPKHQILIYKSTGGSVEFNESYLLSDENDEVKLEAPENEMITFLIRPVAGKFFTDLKINSATDISQQIMYLVNDAEGNDKRINFVMPKQDIIVNLSFGEEERETEAMTEAKPQKETEAETKEEQGSPYGLTLHGLTAEVLSSYQGQFDDREFLQKLGDELYISSAKSEYRTVTDVTFSEEAYEGEQEPDKVYHYIYFNNDPRWKVLATYYVKDKAYLFSEVPEQAPETESENAETEASGSRTEEHTAAGSSASYGGYSNSAPSSGFSQMGAQETTTTSFDIMQVSKTFLKYVGDEEEFYEQTFQYVLLKGQTGNIVGTMSSYKIYPEKEKATFSIVLNTGGTINGKYNRKTKAYSFKGL